MAERSLEVKLRTIWTHEKQRWEESEKRREEKKKEDQKRESLRRKKISEKVLVGKSRNTVFFHWFVAPEGRKVGSLKQRVRSPLGRWETKNCTPLWREAHFEVKMHKTHQVQTTFGTFGNWDVEKVNAVVARSTFRSQNVQSTPGSDHFWKLRCRKSARRCGAKQISKPKCTKHARSRPLLEVEMSKKCTPLWREAHVEVKMSQTLGVRTAFRRSVQMSFRVAGARDCAPCQKWAKRAGFVAFPKMMAGVGHSKMICKDAFSVAGAVRETCSSELLGGQGGDFLRGAAFWSIRSSGLLRWFCVTGAALRRTWHHFFVAGAVL